jgi:hypothetical protein
VAGDAAGVDGGACAGNGIESERHSALAIIDLKLRLIMCSPSIQSRRLTISRCKRKQCTAFRSGEERCDEPGDGRAAAREFCTGVEPASFVIRVENVGSARSSAGLRGLYWRNILRFAPVAHMQGGKTAPLEGARQMNLKLFRLVIVPGFLALSGCYAYPPPPPYAPAPMYPQPTTQQRFDRSWSAAAGALSDQGLTIASQDRGAGVIRGERGSVAVTATVETLTDGRIQVKFTSRGATSADPALMQRVSDSYDRRMGR